MSLDFSKSNYCNCCVIDNFLKKNKSFLTTNVSKNYDNCDNWYHEIFECITINKYNYLKYNLPLYGDIFDYLKIGVKNINEFMNLTIYITSNKNTIAHINNLGLFLYINKDQYITYCKGRWWIDLLFLIPRNISIKLLYLSDLSLSIYNDKNYNINIEFNIKYSLYKSLYCDNHLYLESIIDIYKPINEFELINKQLSYCDYFKSYLVTLNNIGRYLYFYSQDYKDNISEIKIKYGNNNIHTYNPKAIIPKFINDLKYKSYIIIRTMKSKISVDVLKYNIIPYLFDIPKLNEYIYIIDLGDYYNLNQSMYIDILYKNLTETNTICGSLTRNILIQKNGTCSLYFK